MTKGIWTLFLLIGLVLPTHAQEIKKRKLGNYREVEIFAPLEIKIVDENDIMQLYCKTKELTSVILPLQPDEFIESIGTGDDEKVWSVAGVGTKVFTIKPADLADRTSSTVRTNQGRVFHFRMKNLMPDPAMFVANTVEEEEAIKAHLNELATYDPYTVVVVSFREDKIRENEELQLQRMKEDLTSQIQKYRKLTEEVQLAKAELPRRELEAKESFTRAYAELIDVDAFDVDYRNRKAKRSYPVTKVFSDGTFTWVQLPKNAPAFHVYEVQNGKFEVVNFQMEHNLYRIDRVVQQLEFRNGPKGDWVFRVKRKG